MALNYGALKVGKDSSKNKINSLVEKQRKTQQLIKEIVPNSHTQGIKIDKLERYERNRSNDDERIDDLVDSYKRLGFVSQLLVQKIKGKDKYRIVSGHRRWRALLELLKEQPNFLPGREVPCIIIPEDVNDKIVREANIRMNIDTVRLSPKEYREQINELIDLRKNEEGKLTVDATKYIASFFGINELSVYRYSRLNDKLIPELNELMDKGYITQNQADQFTKLNKSTQILFYNDLIKQIEEGNYKPSISTEQFEQLLAQDKASQAEVKEVEKQISANDKKIADREERLEDNSISDYKTTKYVQELEELRRQNEELRRKNELSAKREAESARLNRETKKTINEALKTLAEDTQISDTDKATAIAYSDKLTKLNQAVNNMSNIIYRDRTRLNEEQLSKLKDVSKELIRLIEYCEGK